MTVILSADRSPRLRRRAVSRPILPLVLLSAVLLSVLSASCGRAPEAAAPTPDLIGDWRAVLISPGGELPFTLCIRESGTDLVAMAINGAEEAPFSRVVVNGDDVQLAIDWYDSLIEAHLDDDGRRLRGIWRKTAPEGISTLPFEAVKDDLRRFLPADDEADPTSAEASEPPGDAEVAGSWAVVFRDEDGEERALGEFEQAEGRVTGTFLTPTGDYRFLEGGFRDGRLRLSCFDGAHAFLFDARMQPDGTLIGDFWSRDSYHATWTARRLEADGGEEALPDPFELVRLTNQKQHFDFHLPDLEGRTISLADERFRGKVVLVNLFGSWCPNCNDEAAILVDWYTEYRSRGLEIVGLAFEMTGQPERDAEFVRRFAARHGVEYPLVLAGNSDKREAAAVLGDLDRVVAFPTTLFLDREGRVRRIHSGFAGPGTGQHYSELLAELEGLIEELLAEPVPTESVAG